MNSNALEWLQRISEIQLHGVVCDPLRAMGYLEVRHTHSAIEFGKDIVFLEVDRIGRHFWAAVQVKAKPFSGSITDPKGLRAALAQCEAALDCQFEDPNVSPHFRTFT
jgi:restriction endonuclease